LARAHPVHSPYTPLLVTRACHRLIACDRLLERCHGRPDNDPLSDYLALPEDDPWTYEMIRGELYMSPQARFIHQRVQARLVRLLDEYVERQDLGSIVEPTNLYLDEVNYVQPDISYFTKAQSEALIDEVAVRLVPLLVVELLSSGTAEKDRGTKLRWYTDLGVREYWLVGICRCAVEVIQLRTGTGQQSDPVRSAVLAGLALPLAR